MTKNLNELIFLFTVTILIENAWENIISLSFIVSFIFQFFSRFIRSCVYAVIKCRFSHPRDAIHFSYHLIFTQYSNMPTFFRCKKKELRFWWFTLCFKFFRTRNEIWSNRKKCVYWTLYNFNIPSNFYNHSSTSNSMNCASTNIYLHQLQFN